MTLNQLVAENKRRKDIIFAPYEPIVGIGSPLKRIEFKVSKDESIWIPETMMKEELVKGVAQVENMDTFMNIAFRSFMKNEKSFHQIKDDLLQDLTRRRIAYDFEFWAASAATIQDGDGNMVKFVLNRAQRRMLFELERMRIAGDPIRLILLKARQWGGSTLVQLYMAWMQLFVSKGLNAAVCATVEDQAKHIRGMFSRMAINHPRALYDIVLKPYERSQKNRVIEGRNAVLGIGSFEEPENLRSFTFQMLHLSECASWRETTLRKPENFIQSTRSTVPRKANTLVVLESTAKGVGNFFHREWQAAKDGRSGYFPLFVPWYEIEKYSKPIADYGDFWRSMSERDWYHWELGATLEGINWYNDFKASENYTDEMMNEEFPSTDVEAFVSTGARIFPHKYVVRLRRECCPPEFIGELHGKAITGKDCLKDIEFHANPKGNAYVWSPPDKSIKVSNRYVVFVDIGGRNRKSDWSVIRVLDRYWMIEYDKPEFVFTWRGHTDPDILAWKAAQVATWYNNALLAIEDNKLRDDGEGNFYSVITPIMDAYPNLYSRSDPAKIRDGVPIQYGFHTNVQTKPMIIDRMNAAARDEEYTERDVRACDEMDTFEEKINRRMGAQQGCHDDIVIPTAGCLWLCFDYMERPRMIKDEPVARRAKKIAGEATI